MRLLGHGLALEVARGWEARMWVPDVPTPALNLPVVHLTNFPMPRTRDTYAEEAADSLGRGHVIAALAEFDPASAGRGLYASKGVPRVGVEDLDPRALQRSTPGRAGAQRFFSLDRRAFSLYVMAREGPGLRRALDELSGTLSTLAVGAP